MTDRTGLQEFRNETKSILRSDLARKVAKTFVNRVFMIVLGIASSVVIARALGPAGRGSYYLAVAVAGLLVQFGNFGLHASNTYFVSRDPSRLPTLTGNTLITTLLFMLFAAALGSAVSSLFPDLVVVRGWMAALVVVSVGVSLCYLLLQNLVLGIGDIRHFNLIEAAQGVIGLALIWVVIAADLVTPQNAFATGVIATGIGAGWAYHRIHAQKNGRLRVSRDLYGETLRYGIKAYLAAFASYVVIRSDVVIIGYLLNDTATGYYSIAVSLVDKLMILPITVGTILFPRLAGMASGEGRWRLARTVAQLTLIAMLLTAAITALVGESVIRILFGQVYLPALPSLRILMPGVVLISVNIVLMNYLGATGMPPVTVVAPTVAALVNVVLNLWFIPRWGIEGAALASSIAYGLLLSVTIWYLSTRKSHRLDA